MAASPQDTAFSTPIVTVLGDAADQRYAVLQENYQTLGDLAALTAYQGWQIFGARIDAWRVPSAMFTDICAAMGQRGLSWQDIPPGELTTFDSNQLHALLGKKQRSRTLSVLATRLAEFHLGPHLLPKLRYTELQTLRLGEQKFNLTLQIRQALR